MRSSGWLRIFVAAFCLSLLQAGEPLLVGVDANYSLGMEQEGKQWFWNGKPEDIFEGIARSGVHGFRVRLWTSDDGVNGKAYASEVVQRALAAGLDPYLVIFLSEDWADLMKQPVPTIWKDLDLPARAEAVRVYSKKTVEHFRGLGLRSHLYEIGNEIDYGICGIYPGKSTRKNPEGLSRECWPAAAKIILSAQAGVREADPDAKFLLHIAHWWDPDFCIAFFQFMISQGITVDYAGLSYFPSANIGGSLEMEQFGAVATKLGEAIERPIIVPETAYPATAEFRGQFSRWKKAAPGYPLSPEGQELWIQDFLRYCETHRWIEAVYYWSPEWYGEGMWKGFALFEPNGFDRPAWAGFRKWQNGKKFPSDTVFFELQGGRLKELPVAAARKEAAKVLDEELERHGRVNSDYIKSITARELIVDGSRVNLRASLSGNLELIPPVPQESQSDWGATLAKIKRPSRVVVFSFDGDKKLHGEIESNGKSLGHELRIHPVPAGAALRFGLGNEPRKTVSVEG